jgi:hypothetical protein
MFTRAIQTAKETTQTKSLEFSIHDVQLPIAARCETGVVRDDQKSFAAIACQI